MSIQREVRATGKSTLALVLLIIAGIAGVVFIARWMDSHRPSTDSRVEQERLYVTGQTVRRLSLGFNGLVADWYWMRSLQYVGRKIIDLPEDVQLDHLSQLDLKLLAPLLDTATTLDPQFMEPYQYAAVVLPDIDVQEAIRIIKKGIDANPNAWRLYQHLGYVYWQQKDYQAAAEAYSKGSSLRGAPPWMEAMKAKMAAEGGSRHVAREIYGRMFEQAEDTDVKEMARLRLLQLDAHDQQDVIRKVFAAYQTKFGRCPSSWREVETVLRALRLRVDSSGAPLDPAGTPYLLIATGCEVEIDPRSVVPHK